LKPFTLLWTEIATDQLTAIWLTESDRQAINDAVAAIDHLLTQDPFGKFTGEVAEGLRGVTIISFRVLNAVKADDRIVEVMTILRISS
jgi:hypothetical protein